MLIKINGRPTFFHSIESVEMVKPGSFKVATHNGVYEVGGGRHSGGASNEWFFSGPHYTGTVFANSLKECCKMIDNT